MRHIQIIRVPWSWPLISFGDAGYYGRRWFLILGPALVLIWQMTDAMYAEWCERWFK